jgi:hypothetical protein
VALQKALEHLTQVLQEVKAISDLDRFGSAVCRPVGIVIGAVAAHRFDARMRLQSLHRGRR